MAKERAPQRQPTERGRTHGQSRARQSEIREVSASKCNLGLATVYFQLLLNTNVGVDFWAGSIVEGLSFTNSIYTRSCMMSNHLKIKKMGSERGKALIRTHLLIHIKLAVYSGIALPFCLNQLRHSLFSQTTRMGEALKIEE